MIKKNNIHNLKVVFVELLRLSVGVSVGTSDGHSNVELNSFLSRSWSSKLGWNCSGVERFVDEIEVGVELEWDL